MSKAHDPHWRYVAFRIQGETPLSRRAVQNAVLGRSRREEVPDEEAPQLTRYEWPHAIVRVHHFQLANVREWLPRLTWAVEAAAKVPIEVETLSSSGTIKALTQRLGILQERGQPPEKNKGPSVGGKPRLDAPRRTGSSPTKSPATSPGRGPAPPPGRTPAVPAGTGPAPRPSGGPAPPPGRGGAAPRRQGSSVPPPRRG